MNWCRKEGTALATKIAFVSCAFASLRRKQPAWTEIRAANPDLLIFLGDNAYMSWGGHQDVATDWRFDDLEACYRLQSQVPDYKWLIENVPSLAIWDDHDCGPNDTVGASAPPAFLATSREKFDRWMGFARNNNRPHMYCTYLDIPDVQVIMLDVRTYRTWYDAANATMLGTEQEQWLWRQLDATVTPQRKFTIVCSGSGFTHGADDQTVQDYKAFAEILKQRLAFRPGSNGDVGRRSLFLAGDIHQNEFSTLPEVGVHEAISSGVACFPIGTKVVDKTTENKLRIDKWGLLTIDGETVNFDFHGWSKRPAKLGPEPLHVSIGIDDWKVRTHLVGPPPVGG